MGVICVKCIRVLVSVVSFLICVTISSITALAMDTDFSTEHISPDKQKTFVQNIGISVFTEEPQKSAIDCFDIGENGFVAVGVDAGQAKKVCVYTLGGEFQYGYSFECSGSFGVEWDGENIIIYFVRSDVAVSVDPNGKVDDILKIQNTFENNSVWNNSVFATKKIVDNTEYTLKNDMGILNVFATAYSQLTVRDQGGKERIIYDVSQEYFIKTLCIVIAVIVFVAAVLFALIRMVIKQIHPNKSKSILDNPPDVEVLFEFNGTRHHSAKDGYRPHHLIDGIQLTTGIHHYYDVDEVAPDGSAKGTITFLSPKAYPHCLWVGKKINIQEGERIVGYATITEIYNPILKKK